MTVVANSLQAGRRRGGFANRFGPLLICSASSLLPTAWPSTISIWGINAVVLGGLIAEQPAKCFLDGELGQRNVNTGGFGRGQAAHRTFIFPLSRPIQDGDGEALARTAPSGPRHSGPSTVQLSQAQPVAG